MKTIIAILISVIAAGCLNTPIQTEKTNNTEFNIELLFEKDGCKVYRFNDGGRSIYWTDCRGKVQYSYLISGGKTSRTVRVENETIQ